ncbi:MAG TPA: S8 family serine peptidase [Blastocatellia bacterium]|nr:S8 family serine peptidase [Blastocatellia bacterium]
MRRVLVSLVLFGSFFTVFLLAARHPAHTSNAVRPGRAQIGVDSAYRSRAPKHKVLLSGPDQELRDRLLAQGASLIQDYEAFSLLEVPTTLAEQIAADSDARAAVRDDMNVILLRAGALDTQELAADGGSAEDQPPTADGLYIVQMVGPVKQEWLEQLESNSEVLAYIPNNAYLVRATPQQFAGIEGMKSSPDSFVQWTGDFRTRFKIAPELSLDSGGQVAVTVQIVTTDSLDSDISNLTAMSPGRSIGDATGILKFTNVRLKIPADRIEDVARMSNVVWIEPWQAPELLDERQGLILSSGQTTGQLARPGYLAWLQSKGIRSTPDFLVDIADSGIDQGLLDPQVLHQDFLNQAGLARVVYARLLGTINTEGSPNDVGGHGTLNAAIVGGYNTGTSFPYTDSEGYSFGLGIHPFIKMGVTKIFNPDFTIPDFASMVDQMYRDGARISSNSWGSASNLYTVDCQTYDALVRDARRGDPGNQEMTIVFAAGNRGAGGRLTVPATAKNVITVGASENLRPGLDGCGINSSGGDDPNSIIEFSSGGPTADGRVKPDIVAPGTHIQGAQSQDRFYTGAAVCGPRNYPSGQTLYTWSSGTSHSTPAVAGAAAIIRQFFQQSTGRAPSPAMTKAFLTNSAAYMTGNLAGGDLPGNTQGWGLLNLARALDDTPRLMLDQDRILPGSGQSVALRARILDSGKPLRVTLAWTDAPGTPSAAPTVNDLNLQVEAGGRTYLGNRFNASRSIEGGTADRLNNVESVWLPEGTSGDIVIRVIAANIAGDGVPGNTDTTDQDFALVAYNARSLGDDPGTPVDAPPTASIRYPIGGERQIVGNLVRILWDASDDKSIQSQRVEFSSDGGANFSLLAALDKDARSLDWRIPSIPTQQARIRITVLDGVNLPVSSMSPGNFEIVTGPPDISPPGVQLLTPNGDSTLGGGLTYAITWRETDNVGVIQRVIEFSTDAGDSFQRITSIVAPSGSEQQSYDWQIPIDMSTSKGKLRITVYDGAGNTSSFTSSGKFEVWALPIITDVDYIDGDKDELEVFGRRFRMDQTEIYANGRKLSKIRFREKCDEDTCKKVSSEDKKLNKRVRTGEHTAIVIKLIRTGQTSPEFSFKRKKKQSS